MSKATPCLGGGVAGVSETMPHVGGTRQGVPAGTPYLGRYGRFKEGVPDTTCYVGLSREEFQKPHSMRAGPDIEFQQAGYISAYLQREGGGGGKGQKPCGLCMTQCFNGPFFHLAEPMKPVSEVGMGQTLDEKTKTFTLNVGENLR